MNTTFPSSAAIYPVCLRVERIHLQLRLGVGEEERAVAQPVEVSMAFYFPAVTGVSHTDQGDFVCYDKISRMLKERFERGEFRLIEYVGMEMYREVRKDVPSEVKMTLSFHKCQVLLPFVKGGASFTYTDLPPFSWTPPT